MPMISFPTAAGGHDVEVNLADFASVMERLALHGLQQKVADAVANAKAKGWTQDECHEKCLAVMDNLRAGEWSGRSRGATFDDMLTAAFKAAIRKKDKDCNGKALADRIAAAKVNPANAGFIAAQRRVWDAMQTDATLDV